MTLKDLKEAIQALEKADVDLDCEVMILSDTDPLRVVDVVAPQVLLEKDIHKYKMVHLGYTKPMERAGFKFPFVP